jgi:hypothetical protein
MGRYVTFRIPHHGPFDVAGLIDRWGAATGSRLGEGLVVGESHCAVIRQACSVVQTGCFVVNSGLARIGQDPPAATD